MVMQIAAVHQIQYEAQLIGGMKRIRHAHYEWAVHLR